MRWQLMARVWRGRHNYELNSVTVRQDLYRLLCLVLADRLIVEEAQELERDPLMILRNEFVEDELVHLIISTAVTNRLQLEHLRGHRGVDVACGEITPDVLQDRIEPLRFRDACNKII